MPADSIGLDIGGANLKAATASGDAMTVPFELWRHPERLADELTLVRSRWPEFGRVAVTMTGEFCDCFHTKRDGVRHILAAVKTVFGDAALLVWTTAGELVPVRQFERSDALLAAAANWLALATYVGRWARTGAAILIDTGSTTTDVIPLENGRPAPTGRTDSERLRSGELVYTGVRRTPVCAVLGPAVAAEWFATTHDVYVRLCRLPAEPECRATADGRPMTPEFVHARLARMLGGDPEITPPADTWVLADRAHGVQRATIAAAIRRVLERLSVPPKTVIVSGSGEFLARAAWEELTPSREWSAVRVQSLAELVGASCSEAACARAMAVLAWERTCD